MKDDSTDDITLTMSKISAVNMQASAKLMDVIDNISAEPPFKVTMRKIFANR